jgi:uncharacterized membrane protein HdeD (DUF308 family)
VDYLFVRSAGALAIRGAIAIVLGLFALIMPGLTFLALTIAFGVYAFIDGISALAAMFDRRTRLHRGWLAVEAIAGILVGIFTAIWPMIAAVNLALVIAAWAIITGIFKIVNAIRLRKQIRDEALLILSGIASVIFGGILAFMPLVGIVGLMWAVGIFGLVFGGLLVALSIRMQRWQEVPGAEMPRAA